jgi:hypothetical protein
MARRTILLMAVAALSLAAMPSAQAGSASLATCFGQEATEVGTPAPDTLTGTPGRDVIYGDTGER